MNRIQESLKKTKGYRRYITVQLFRKQLQTLYIYNKQTNYKTKASS